MAKTFKISPTKGEERYVDFDYDSGLWCVLGTESGFVYSSHAAENQAKKALQQNCCRKAA